VEVKHHFIFVRSVIVDLRRIQMSGQSQQTVNGRNMSKKMPNQAMQRTPFGRR
jgi:hypothetical protein